jgi:hypothetical protein
MPAGEPRPQVRYASMIYCQPDPVTLLRIMELLLILSILFLLDVMTTQIILIMGGVELNPLMAGIVAHPALHLGIKMLLLILILPISLMAEKRVKGSAAFFYCILILLYSVVDMNNLFVILPQIAR